VYQNTTPNNSTRKYYFPRAKMTEKSSSPKASAPSSPVAAVAPAHKRDNSFLHNAEEAAASLAPPGDANEAEAQHASRSTSLSGNDEKAVGEDGGPVVDAPRGLSWVLVVIAILSSTFLFAIDNTIVADVQPTIVERFDSIEQLPWLSVAFLLGVVATILAYGKLYSLFNAKWLYITCVVIFEAGSALCGAAPSMDALIVGRTIAGVGGAGMYVGVMTLLSVTTSIQERPMYLGFTGITWGLGTVLGPVIGGAFTDSSATWRWGFYINLVIGGVFAPVYLFLLPSFNPRPNDSLKKKLVEIDWIGLTLMIGFFTSLLMAISMGGQIWAWGSARSIALFVVFAVLIIAFGIQQTFTIFTTVENRLFPIQFLRQPAILVLFACTSSAAAAIFVPIYFIPIFFQFSRGDSALDAAVRLLPFIILLVFFCLFNGFAMSKYGLYMPWYLFGGILVVIGSALMMTQVDQNTSTSKIYGFSVLTAIGAGGFVQASFSVAQAKTTPNEIPAAIGFISMGQTLGGTIALAIANSLFLNDSTKAITALLPNASVSQVQSAVAGTGGTFLNSLSADQRTAVIGAVVNSIDKIYALGITAGALVIVLSLTMKYERLFLEAGAAA
jgi:MFS family permease